MLAVIDFWQPVIAIIILWDSVVAEKRFEQTDGILGIILPPVGRQRVLALGRPFLVIGRQMPAGFSDSQARCATAGNGRWSPEHWTHRAKH